MATFKRTPPPEDAELLRYAGLMGHRFVLIDFVVSCGRRRVRLETDDHGGYVNLIREGYHALAVYEQKRPKSGGRRWRRVL